MNTTKPANLPNDYIKFLNERCSDINPQLTEFVKRYSSELKLLYPHDPSRQYAFYAPAHMEDTALQPLMHSSGFEFPAATGYNWVATHDNPQHTILFLDEYHHVDQLVVKINQVSHRYVDPLRSMLESPIEHMGLLVAIAKLFEPLEQGPSVASNQNAQHILDQANLSAAEMHIVIATAKQIVANRQLCESQTP